MKDKIGWGLLSTARINRRVLGAMASSERGRVVAVASRGPDRAKAYASEKAVPKWHGSYEALLEDPDVQIVYNPLPNSLHAEWTIKALEAGKHVLCEKPFAITLKEVDAVFEAARKTDRVAAEALMYRHHPKIKRIKELIGQGAIGKPESLQAEFFITLDRPKDVRWDPGLGGGALWDLGIYPLSLGQYIFGPSEVIIANENKAGSGVDETFWGTVVHPSKKEPSTIAKFSVSYIQPWKMAAEILGSEGSMRLTNAFSPDSDQSHLFLQKGKDPPKSEEIKLDNPAMFLLEIEDMHDAVLGIKPPLITPEETRGHIESILRLYDWTRGSSPSKK